VMGDWRGASPSPIDKVSGATIAGAAAFSLAAPSLNPVNNNELQVYFYGAQSGAAPNVGVSSALTQRFDVRSSKEGFTLAVAELAAPSAGTASATYPATSSSAAMTAQAVLLVPGSHGTNVNSPAQSPTPTATATPALTAGAITFVGAGPLSDFSSAVTTVSVGLPTGVESGDTLIAQIVVYNGSGSDAPVTPSGWSSIRHDSVNEGNSASTGNQITSWLYYRVAGSNEPASYGWTIGSNWAAGVMGDWRGASASPIDKASGATAAGASPVSDSAPSLVPNNDNELQIYFYSSQAYTGPTLSLSPALSQRFNAKSSKEGFSLSFADVAAPSADNKSPAYPATASISGSAAMTAQDVLLVPGSSTPVTATVSQSRSSPKVNLRKRRAKPNATT
jgi:hypothetical protein